MRNANRQLVPDKLAVFTPALVRRTGIADDVRQRQKRRCFRGKLTDDRVARSVVEGTVSKAPSRRGGEWSGGGLEVVAFRALLYIVMAALSIPRLEDAAPHSPLSALHFPL